MLNNSLRLFKAIFEFNFDISYFSMLQRVQPCFELNLFFVRAKISFFNLKIRSIDNYLKKVTEKFFKIGNY